MLFQAVVKCLSIIAPEKEIPTELGKGMSGRVSACAKVAQAVKVLKRQKVKCVLYYFFLIQKIIRKLDTKVTLVIINFFIQIQVILEHF